MRGFAALFGAVLGFLGAAVPVLLELWQNRSEHKRRLEERQQELDACKQGFEFAQTHPDVDLAAASAEQMAIMLEDAREIKGHPALEFLRSSVRPVLTYAFFGLYAIIKLSSLFHGMHTDHVPVLQLLPTVWDEDAESLFAAVVSFWFGSRVVQNSRILQRPKVRITDALKGHNGGQPVVADE